MRSSAWSSDVCSSDLVPEGNDWSAGDWMAVTNDPFLINFLHRWWAWATALALLLLARALWRRGGQGEAAGLVLVVAGQVALGIATVVTGVSMWIAVSHRDRKSTRLNSSH